MELENGGRVGVVGGGPAGSLFSYFLLELASRVDLDLHVDIWEPKNFNTVGPGGCNCCGGIISESLVQLLATEGLTIPGGVAQRGIDSYVMHTDLGRVRIAAPGMERRIAAVHRGGGPRGSVQSTYGSFDGFLLAKAREKGAEVVPMRVNHLGWDEGRPFIEAQGAPRRTYDLLVGALGINSAALRLFQDLGFGYELPRGAKTYISELHLGAEVIDRYLGHSMHVFLMNYPGVEFLAIIPKGEYATLCVLGKNVDRDFVDRLFDTPEVRRCLPPAWKKSEVSCYCMPKINVGKAKGFFADRVVMIGDAGVSRLYKDGIGAAYKTAKACATTAIFEGIDRAAFERYYWKACQRLERDNLIGHLIFSVVALFQNVKPLREGMVRMVEAEQTNNQKQMSSVLWDTFTGSAPYRDILLRTIRPRFLTRLMIESIGGLLHPQAPMMKRTIS